MKYTGILRITIVGYKMYRISCMLDEKSTFDKIANTITIRNKLSIITEINSTIDFIVGNCATRFFGSRAYNKSEVIGKIATIAPQIINNDLLTCAVVAVKCANKNNSIRTNA